MPYYAMVVVIAAPGHEDAYNRVAIAVGVDDDVQFVGSPWGVEPVNADALRAGEIFRATGDERVRAVAEFSPEFDTGSVIERRTN